MSPRLRTLLRSPRYRGPRVVLAILLFLLGLHVLAELGTDREDVLSHTEVEPGGEHRELVVLLHGYVKGRSSLADLMEVARQELPDADFLAPEYSSGLLSNIPPEEVAKHLRFQIGEVFDERRRVGRPYERVILVGHSAGALIVRQAYLDQWNLALQRGLEDTWAQSVDRVVLLAGMNRGWSLTPKPPHMHWSKKLLCRFGHFLGRLSGTSRFVRALERGSPFVGDLRIQWVRAAHDEDIRLAPVFQMLGLTDDVVTREDNMDLLAAEGFTFIETPGGHRSIVEFGDTPQGRHRRATFARLISTEDPAGLRDTASEEAMARMLGKRDDVDHVVFIMHGIRDDAEWIGGLKRRIEERARARLEAGETDERVAVVTSEYGFFPMGSFLISPWRMAKVRWFVDRYTEELARTTVEDAEISFIGHSNGTYLLARGLQDYAQLRFRNVAFAGSVIPQDYPWDGMLREGPGQRVQAFRNDCGDKDWVVAIFPHLFQQLASLSGQREGWLAELGSGGFNGFLEQEGHSRETVISGPHGAGIVEPNFDSLAAFVLTGEGGPASELVVPGNDVHWFVRTLSRIAWLIWMLLGALVVLAGLLLTRRLARARRLRVSYWVSWPAYVLLLILILQTV